MKTLEQMSEGGCKPTWYGRVLRLDGKVCYEMLAAIAAVLLFMARVYSRHGVWTILEEGSGVGDVHVVFRGDENAQ
jgi:hypothetical protein